MREKLFRKIKENKAFTMIETVIVVGIIVVLLGVSIVGISGLVNNLKMIELDDHAKVIFLEAQNQLGLIEVEGGLGAYHEEIREQYPSGSGLNGLRFLKEIYKEPYTSKDKPEDYPDGAEKMWEQMCYLKKTDSLSTRLISQNSDIYANGGSYLIEFNAQTGDIYGVFYWESNEELTYEEILKLRSRLRSDRTDKKIGYYGGAVSGDLSKDTEIKKQSVLINGEELYLKISFDKTPELVQFYNTALDISVTITGENGKTVEFERIDVSNAIETLDTIDIYMLLDSMHEGYGFDDIVNAGLSEENKITPGEDIKIEIKSHFNHDTGRWSLTETVEGNSLFAHNTDDSVIRISNVRHLMNLDESSYDAEKFGRDTIQFNRDVDFDKNGYSWDLDAAHKPCIKGYGKASRPFDSIEPIVNDKLFDSIQIKGDNYAMQNFVVKPADAIEGTPATNVGIFKQTKNVKFSNLYIENIRVEASAYDNVGALVGYMQGGSIEKCGVYLATSGDVNGTIIDYCKTMDTDASCAGIHDNKMEHNYNTYVIIGNNNVGGFIGAVEDVSGSETLINLGFAAIKIECAGENAGGFIGSVKNVNGSQITIKNSYATGDITGNKYVGGFIGAVSATGNNVLVSDIYTTSDIYAEQYFGGFLGRSENAKYVNCTSYGHVFDLIALNGKDILVDEDYVGGFVSQACSMGDSFTSCVYMIQNGYNTETAIKDPVDAEGNKHITTEKYSNMLVNGASGVLSYPYDVNLYLRAFPFKTLEGQAKHYGDWPTPFMIDTSLVYYEIYADGGYGYYCVTTISDSESIWILNTLRNETCVEDGYGLLTKYNLGKISYDLYVGNVETSYTGENMHFQGTGDVVIKEHITDGVSVDGKFIRLNQLKGLNFYGVEDYDEVNGTEGARTGESFEANNMYLYQLPYDLQCTDRSGIEYFYDRIKFTATAQGSNKKVIDGLSYLYCPHFAKTAVNPNVNALVEIKDEDYPTIYENPRNVSVRSARQLNSLGRFCYYWNPRHGFGEKVNYIQETDINFSTYVKTYGGRDFDLQDFSKDYRNRPIGNSDYAFLGETKFAGPFKNSYDGQSYKIIDFCLDVSDVQFVGLFGEIQDASLKNIIMVMSDNPKGNAGIITSDYKTWMTPEDYSRRREMRASVGALLGMAYDNSYCDIASNTIDNCAAAGYTVQYVLSKDPNPHLPSGSTSLDPLGVVIGGLIGYGESHITNCYASNNVVLKLEKDYTNTYAYFDYYYDLGQFKPLNDANKGGIVNMGGFVGSYLYNKIENCYSGGTIKVIDGGYDVPHLRVGNFCAGWLDTRAYGLDYTDWQKYEQGKRVCSCGDWCSGNDDPFYTFEYVNCYTYTSIDDSVWNVKTSKTMSYVPFASRKVDFFTRYTNSTIEQSCFGRWKIADTVPAQYTNFDNVYYLDAVAVMDKVADADKNSGQGQSITSDDLEARATTKANYTYKNADKAAVIDYPYQAVVKDVKTGKYFHYGEWPDMAKNILAYYEKYDDGTYGYYAVIDGVGEGRKWVLNTLINKTCVEDGYGLLAGSQYDKISYTMTLNSITKSGTQDNPQLINKQSNLRLVAYKQYDDVLGKATSSTGQVYVTGEMYLYKLPYEIQNLERGSASSYYSKIIFNATASGKSVIDGATFWFNPHFAKAAFGYQPSAKPTNVYVRSARQLNILGRYSYYWSLRGGAAGNQKVTYVQETDINFSTYVKTYAGKEFDLQAFGKSYSNRPIGESVYSNDMNVHLTESQKVAKYFRNNYDGQSHKIIDYCVDGGTDKQYVGLFGAITEATLKNIVMVVSSNPTGNGGLITSRYHSKHIWDNDINFACVGMGSLIGLAYENPTTGAKNTIVNCATAGYTVKYQLDKVNGLREDIGENIIDQNDPMEPLAIVIGGLVGFTTSDISNSTAVNDIVLDMKKDYLHSYDNYLQNVNYTGGVVYLGGFAGSVSYGKITDCYSGGSIDIINTEKKNGKQYTYSIPKLRIGGFCPGWLDVPINGVRYSSTGTIQYSNIYSYTEVSKNVWDIPGKKNWNESNQSFAETSDIRFTHFIPLVSSLVDHYDESKLDDGEWKHDLKLSADKIKFSNNYYLKEMVVNHIDKVPSNVKAYYTDAATAKIFEELAALATTKATESYVTADVRSSTDYPYQAVTYEVDSNGNRTSYVHYGEWFNVPQKPAVDTNTMLYYETYADNTTSYMYIGANGTTYNYLTTDPTKVIIDAGYCYYEYDLAAKDYVLKKLQMSDSIYEQAKNKKYVEFTCNGRTVYINPYFGAAISSKTDLGSESNPLQVRTKEQFMNIATLSGGDKYIKQTHDVDMKNSNTPITLLSGVYYDGGADTGCVIKNPSAAIFNQNESIIKNTKVVAFNGTKSDGVIAGFVMLNLGAIENCSVYADLIKGKEAYGFVAVNRKPIKNCTVVGKIEGTSKAAGFVGEIIEGSIYNCTVGSTDQQTSIKAQNAYGFAEINKHPMSNCSVQGKVTVEGTDIAVGFIGQNETTVSNCYVYGKNGYGDVVIKGKEAYGFIGTSNNGPVSGCFVVGTIQGTNKAAGFAKDNNGTLSNSYVNAIISTTSTSSSAKAAGFVFSTSVGIDSAYACGSVTSYTTYGFMESGSASNCYTIVEQAGTTMYGFAPTTASVFNCYWGYDAYRDHNIAAAKANKGCGTRVTLADIDTAATDSQAVPFSDNLKSEKYPYTTVGLTHYGDWPLASHFYTDYDGEDLLRAGLYYCEVYYDYLNDKEVYGVYGIGDYFDSSYKVRVIGRTINTLMKGNPENVVKIRSYFGVYYNMNIAAPDWKVNWKFIEGEVETSVGKPSPNGIFGDLTDGFIPEAFDTYLFCELKGIESNGLAGDSVKAIATIFYKTNIYGGKHADTNYDDGHFYYEDKTKVDATNGVELTITLDEVEKARKGN